MTAVYELECIDCAFQTTVVGEFREAIEETEAHRAEQEVAPDAHFVNIRRRA